MSPEVNNSQAKRKQRVFCMILILLAAAFNQTGCDAFSSRYPSKMDAYPKRILWAWERPEDLQFLDHAKYGVAFLAQTIELKEKGVEVIPRRQPLKVKPETHLIAVTRIESPRDGKTDLSDEQITKVSEMILNTMQLKSVSAVQIDFDAKESERDFYKNLLTKVKLALPDYTPLSITAIASFCVGDRWTDRIAADEIVPMLFRMGADEKKIRDHFANGGDFNGQMCKESYGISIDEPLPKMPDTSRRIYIFNPRSWTPGDVRSLKLD